MSSTVRTFLLVEALAFGLASLVHRGILIEGYYHQGAYTAETVIAAVLALGLVVSLLAPSRTHPAALAAQGFALLGTCVGLLTIAIGVGPRTVPDVVYHLAIVAVLGWGLVVAARGRRAGVHAPR